MGPAEWDQPFARCLGMLLAGAEIAEVDAHGQPIRDDDLLLLFNAHHEDVNFQIPPLPGEAWEPVLDTWEPQGTPPAQTLEAASAYPLRARSLAVLRRKATTS
jgi:isoamylase